MPPRPLGLLTALAILAAAGGCGDKPPREVALALDFAPNAAQAPVFSAVRHGLDRRAGIRLRIRQPGQGPDGVKLVAAGRAQLALLDIQDLPIARREGADVVAIGALVGRPLGALVARPGIRRPRDLEHRTVGVSGLPSDPAFLDAIVKADGGDAATVRRVLIGFNGVQRLLTHRVDAVPAFWSVEGVALRRRGLPVEVFKVDDYGAPPYPEVVIVTSRATLARRRADLRAALSAITGGVAATREDPEGAVDAIAAAGGGNRGLVRAQLRAVTPAFATTLRLDRAVLERWASWAAEVGIVERRPDVDAAFVFDLGGGDARVPPTPSPRPRAALEAPHLAASQPRALLASSRLRDGTHSVRAFADAQPRDADSVAGRADRCSCPSIILLGREQEYEVRVKPPDTDKRLRGRTGAHPSAAPRGQLRPCERSQSAMPVRTLASPARWPMSR